MRTLQTLGHPEAQAAIAAMLVMLEQQIKYPAVLAVADVAGELVALLRCDGAPLASTQIATNKAFTAARERRPSGALGEEVRTKSTDIAYYSDPRYIGFGGGLPVEINGQVVGSVAVSGLSEEDDIAVAAVGVKAITGS